MRLPGTQQKGAVLCRSVPVASLSPLQEEAGSAGKQVPALHRLAGCAVPLSAVSCPRPALASAACPDRGAKRCLRSLTVLVSSKNTLVQQQTGAHEISTIPDHDLPARARCKAQYDRAAALFHYIVHHDRRLQRYFPLAHGI